MTKKGKKSYQLVNVKPVTEWWWKMANVSRVTGITTCHLCGKEWKTKQYARSNFKFREHVEEHITKKRRRRWKNK